MKKIIALLLIGILLNLGFEIVALPNESTNTEKIIENISISKPLFSEKDNYLSIHIDEANSYIYEPGNPLLPAITKVYEFPLGTTIKNVDIDYISSTYRLSEKIIPASNPILHSKDIQQEPLKSMQNIDIYTSSELFPSNLYTISKGAGINEGQHTLFLKVKMSPQYQPMDDILIVPTTIDITIEYILPDTQLFTHDEFDMVIITPEKFLSTLQPLLNHKNNVNTKTFVKTTEQIYNEFKGIDSAEEIKLFIKDAVETQGISYVLLIGDVNHMPIRKTMIKSDLPIEDAITDLYYADLYKQNGNFSSWDSNGNGVFGEFIPENFNPPGDVIDLYPDIYIGRIPCSDTAQLSLVVNKIITYESNTHGTSWFNNVILMGGDTFPGNEIMEGELVTNIIGQHMESFGYNLKTLWTSLGTFKPRNINEQITKGAGFVSYSGHGYEQGFGTSPPKKEKRIQYFSPYLIGMENGEKLPIFFLDACSTTKLDFTIQDLKEWYPLPFVMLLAYFSEIPYNLENLYPCFSWELVKKPNGGAIASMGATRIAFLGMANDEVVGGIAFLNIKFFESYNGDNNIGLLFNKAVTSYINDAGWEEPITPQEFILIGDPSLKIGGYT